MSERDPNKQELTALARAMADVLGWDFDRCPPDGDPGMTSWTQADFLDAAAVARARLDNILLVKRHGRQS